MVRPLPFIFHILTIFPAVAHVACVTSSVAFSNRLDFLTRAATWTQVHTAGRCRGRESQQGSMSNVPSSLVRRHPPWLVDCFRVAKRMQIWLTSTSILRQVPAHVSSLGFSILLYSSILFACAFESFFPFDDVLSLLVAGRRFVY